MGATPPPDVPRSYVDDGRTVTWSCAAPRAAVDAERRREDPPHVLVAAARLVPEAADAWAAWTVLEVEAKLADVPVVLLALGKVPRPVDDVEVRTVTLGDLTVSVGRSASAGPFRPRRAGG